MKWAVFNFVVSVIGAAVNLLLVMDSNNQLKPVCAVLTVLLIIRAVKYLKRIVAS